MRSSKSRSRGNKNRNTNRPTGGNIINRVFDSSGPDGKVRGTPQQIIEKYNQLHRDAQLSNDRVNAENFAQHAEHYLRLLAEAQREVDKQREEQEEQNRARQAERDRERNEQEELNRVRQAERDRERAEHDEQNRARQADRDRERNERLRAQERDANGMDTAQPAASAADEPDAPSGLVDTPEARRTDNAPQQDAAPAAANDAPAAAPRARKPRAPRKPRPKPEGEAVPAAPRGGDTPD